MALVRPCCIENGVRAVRPADTLIVDDLVIVGPTSPLLRTIGAQEGPSGFERGECSGTLPEGVSELAGTHDPESAEYGTYQWDTGLLTAWIPKFYYKVGNGLNGMDANTITTAGLDVFPTTEAASAAGFSVHPAFVDSGGAERSGFWTADSVAPVVTLANGPANPTNITSTDIVVSGAVQYIWKIDEGEWSSATPISTHIALSGLAVGSHTLEVKGIRASGLEQYVPTTLTWTVTQ